MGLESKPTGEVVFGISMAHTALETLSIIFLGTCVHQSVGSTRGVTVHCFCISYIRISVFGPTLMHNHKSMGPVPGPNGYDARPVIVNRESSQAQQRLVICDNSEWEKAQVMPETTNSPHYRQQFRIVRRPPLFSSCEGVTSIGHRLLQAVFVLCQHRPHSKMRSVFAQCETLSKVWVTHDRFRANNISQELKCFLAVFCPFKLDILPC